VKQSVSTVCEKCGKFFHVAVDDGTTISCPNCSQTWPMKGSHFLEEACPVCGCKGFFVQKDFNQVIGCAVMLLGMLLVPWTYGLSLPVFAFIDWLLYKKIGDVAVCYRCRTEYRGFQIPKEIEPFDHFKGMKYEPKKVHLKGKQ